MQAVVDDQAHLCKGDDTRDSYGSIDEGVPP